MGSTANFDELSLFPAADYHAAPAQRYKPLTAALWTESKAALVARYLHYFVFVTHHGTYIDAFAGPQNDTLAEGWAAELVLQNRPAWLNRFLLIDKGESQCQSLEDLKARNEGRDVDVVCGDSNVVLPELLPRGSIRDKEATFCLLDQRTFECQWSTVEHVASIKPSGYKVEQFYFLAQGWLNRSFQATRTDEGARRIFEWWGGDGWNALLPMSGPERGEAFKARFENELGYRQATAWPIYQRANAEGRIMYYMIHATDHPAAPPLMRRAYEWALKPRYETQSQLELEFQELRTAELD